ncbi:MAG: CRTAC1 family protein [Blastocatellia bacterium]|nr:CRTAC1 family protein [Blastocatellia bacterium]
MRRIFICYLLSFLLAMAGCINPPAPGDAPGGGNANQPSQTAEEQAQAQAEAPSPEQAPRYSGPIQFIDATEQAGLRFKHNSGARGKKYMPETVGSGCAFLDYDNDGWQDMLLINSMNWPENKGAKTFSSLYRNNRDGTFTDVTKEAGLAVEMYGLGCAVADYDNDGHLDLYITCLGANRLFRNAGGGRFIDVTAKAGVGDPGFSTSAAWLDYDKDGKLDLFVCNYVEWSIDKDQYCTLDGKNKSYCTPEKYKGQSSVLYRNKGDGTFENVTQKAGLYDPTGKSLGVVTLDYDDDGWTDIFVANDTQPNKLYRNKGDGTFTDEAMTAGVAFSEAGVARAGMGADAADYDGSGRISLVIGNFSNEMMALYHNEGTGLFIDEAPTSTIGQDSLLTLTFACFFFDYDLDGLPDIFAANGHVSDDITVVQPKIQYAQPPHLFRNLGKKKFKDMAPNLGSAIQQPAVGRGAAYGDYDNDGDLDLLITSNNGPARLLRNEGGNQNNLLRIKTIGTASNRNAIGAKITLTLPDKKRLMNVVKTGSSYCSQSELTLTFGLGKVDKVQTIEIVWPNGNKQTLSDVNANQEITIEEGKGITSSGEIVFTRP